MDVHYYLIIKRYTLFLQKFSTKQHIFNVPVTALSSDVVSVKNKKKKKKKEKKKPASITFM